MKILYTLLASFLLPFAAGAQIASYGELYDNEQTADMRAAVEYLSALGGRGAGTSGEASAADYIASAFENAGIELLSSTDDISFGVLQRGGDTLRSHNVCGIVQGYDPSLKDRYIVIGARLDNLGTAVTTVDGVQVEKTFPGANGNASGLAMLISLARKLSAGSVLLKRSVILCAFGASLPDNAGSWYFVNRSFAGKDRIDAMVNLDMVGTGSRGFYAYTASNADLNQIVNDLAGTLQPMHPRLVTAEPVQSDHRSFYAAGIPSILFTTGMYPEYNTPYDLPSVVEYDNMEREMEYIWNFTLKLVNGSAPAFSPREVRNEAPETGAVAWADCDVKPAFLNNYNPEVFLRKWVYTYLRYPKEAVDEGIQGKVLVDFVIDEKGDVGNVKVLKGVDPLLDQEAVRVVAASPRWKPARVRGKKVKCEMSMYVEFRLKQRK